MTATRPTRWERRPDDRPNELLDAAFRTFAENGYRATRLEQVAEAAGVTKGTIYYYFRNKEDLFRQTIVRHRDLTRARLDDVMRDTGGSVASRLRAGLCAAWREAEGPNGAMLRLMVGEVCIEAPELFRAWFDESVEQGGRDLAAIVREGQASGEFRADADADVAARQFISAVFMQALMQHHGVGAADSLPQERRIEGGVELFLHALRPLRPLRPLPAAEAR